jgi:hypothetical protein
VKPDCWPDFAGSLTPSERRVAELAAVGQTNHGIATGRPASASAMLERMDTDWLRRLDLELMAR